MAKKKARKAPLKPISFTQRPAPRVDRRSGLDDDSWVATGSWVGVKSSNVAQIQYDQENRRLHVAFRGGQTWRYEQVPEGVARLMFNCSSMGAFVSRYLKGKFLAYEIL